MTIAWRVRIAARTVRAALHPLRPQSYWQVWLSAAGVPLVVLVVGLGLRMIFHTWPQLDLSSAIGNVGCVALVGSRQSLTLRRRRRAIASRVQS